MTLIALTLNYGNPVMMADLLISSVDSDGIIETPTFVNGTGDLLTNLQGSKPMALVQKLYIINDRLCVALGGRGDQMLTFLNRMKAFYGSVDFKYVNLHEFTTHYSQEDGSELIAIILSSTKDDKGIRFNVLTIGDIPFHENQMYSRVWAAGSGVNQFLNFINAPNKFGTDIPDPVTAMNISLMGYWLGHEVAVGESLSNKWGAGYEMILFREGKFVKLEEYTVVLLAAKNGKGIEFEPAPINTIMFNYQDDYLVIRAHAADKQKIFVAPRIDDRNTELGVTDYEHKHNTLLVTYIIKNVDEGTIQFRVIALPRNINELDQTPVKIEIVNGKMRLYTDTRQDNFIRDSILTN